jgi:hypothetical protein
MPLNSALRGGLSKVFKRAASRLLVWATMLQPALSPIDNSQPDRALIEKRHRELVPYYEQQAQEIKNFFQAQGFVVADSLFDYLIKLKKDGIRKDGYTPDIGHEIDQILPLITSLTKGDMKDARAAIEKEHGNIEKWFCSILAHDIGEDFGLFAEDLCSELTRRVQEKTNTCPTGQQAGIILNAGQSMERLTHYRKFSEKDIARLTGMNIDLGQLNPGEVRDLSQFKDFFWNKMDILERDGWENLQVYATLDKKGKPYIYVTQYGASNPDASVEPRWGAEWNLYIQSVEEGDIYDILTKMGDRMQGVASRIAVEDFDLREYTEYFSESDYMFRLTSPATMTSEWLYKNTPLKPYIQSIENMLSVLLTLGSIYALHHPQNRTAAHGAKRGFNPEHVGYLRGTAGRSPIYLSSYFEAGANLLYEHTPRLSHPVAVFMRQCRDVRGQNLERGHITLYKECIRALCEEGGPAIQRLLKRKGFLTDAPEATEPHLSQIPH